MHDDAKDILMFFVKPNSKKTNEMKTIKKQKHDRGSGQGDGTKRKNEAIRQDN